MGDISKDFIFNNMENPFWIDTCTILPYILILLIIAIFQTFINIWWKKTILYKSLDFLSKGLLCYCSCCWILLDYWLSVSLNNHSCTNRPTLIDLNPYEPYYYPFTISIKSVMEVLILLKIHLVQDVFRIKCRV